MGEAFIDDEDKLRALAAEHSVEEIAILTTLHDPEARQRSYALLAREFGLKGESECRSTL